MSPFIIMTIGSIVRTLLTAGGTAAAVTATTPEGVSDPVQAAIGIIGVAVAQLWSLYQKGKIAKAEE